MISVLYNRKLRLKNEVTFRTKNQVQITDSTIIQKQLHLSTSISWREKKKNIYIYICKTYKVILRQYLFPKLFLL